MGKVVERSVTMVGAGGVTTGGQKDPDQKSWAENMLAIMLGGLAYTIAVQLLFGAGFLLGKIAGFLFTGANCEILGMPFEVLTGLLVVIHLMRRPKVEIGGA